MVGGSCWGGGCGDDVDGGREVKKGMSTFGRDVGLSTNGDCGLCIGLRKKMCEIQVSFSELEEVAAAYSTRSLFPLCGRMVLFAAIGSFSMSIDR